MLRFASLFLIAIMSALALFGAAQHDAHHTVYQAEIVAAQDCEQFSPSAHDHGARTGCCHMASLCSNVSAELAPQHMTAHRLDFERPSWPMYNYPAKPRFSLDLDTPPPRRLG